MHGTSHSHQLTKPCLTFDSSCLWDRLALSIVKQHTFFLVVLRRPRSFKVLASCWVQWMSSLWLSAIEVWRGKTKFVIHLLVSDLISGWADSHDFSLRLDRVQFLEDLINVLPDGDGCELKIVLFLDSCISFCAYQLHVVVELQCTCSFSRTAFQGIDAFFWGINVQYWWELGRFWPRNYWHKILEFHSLCEGINFYYWKVEEALVKITLLG